MLHTLHKGKAGDKSENAVREKRWATTWNRGGLNPNLKQGESHDQDAQLEHANGKQRIILYKCSSRKYKIYLSCL